MNLNLRNCLNCNSATLLPHTNKFYLCQLLFQHKHLFFWCKKISNLKIPSSFNISEGKDSTANLVNIPHKKTLFLVIVVHLQKMKWVPYVGFHQWCLHDKSVLFSCLWDFTWFLLTKDRCNSLYPLYPLRFHYWNKPQNQ